MIYLIIFLLACIAFFSWCGRVYNKLHTWTDIEISKLTNYDYLVSYTDGYNNRHSYRGRSYVWYYPETGELVYEKTKSRKLAAIYQKEEWRINEDHFKQEKH